MRLDHLRIYTPSVYILIIWFDVGVFLHFIDELLSNASPGYNWTTKYIQWVCVTKY